MRSLENVERETEGVKLAGVCAAISDRWDVDPLLVRAGFCILGLSNGVGLVLYGAAWLMWPARGGIAPIDQVFPGARRLPKVVLWGGLVVACIMVMSTLSGFTPFGFGPAVVMGLVWWFAVRRQRKQHRRLERNRVPSRPDGQQDPHPGKTPFDDASARWQARVAEHHRQQSRAESRGLGAGSSGQPYGAGLWTSESGTTDPAPTGHRPYGGPQPASRTAPSPAEAPRHSAAPRHCEPPRSVPAEHPAATVHAPYRPSEPAYADQPAEPLLPAASAPTEALPDTATDTAVQERPRRLRPVWPWVLLASALALVAVESASGPHPLPVIYPAAVLAVIGLSLMLCTRRGRPRGLLAAGIVMTLVTGFVAAATPYQTQLDVPVTNATISQPAAYEVGTVTEDLRDVTITEPTERRVNLEVGQLTVLVPRDTNVNVHWTTDAGSVQVNPRNGKQSREFGADLAGTTRIEGADPTAPTLELYVHVEVGDLEVRQ